MGAKLGTLTLVAGLPGAGKTTFARQLEERGGVRFCPDEWMHQLGFDLFDEPGRARVEGLQWELTAQLLARGVWVVVESGFWRRADREILRLAGQGLGARVELIFLHAPLPVLWDRVQRRHVARGWEVRAITREEMERWSAYLEHPDAAELAAYDSSRVLGAGPAA